jgi:signal transduction histidine kinase
VTRPRLAAWLPVCMWTLAVALWAAGMVLWLASATRHIPAHGGPVAASVGTAASSITADTAGFEITFNTAYLIVTTVGALIATRQHRNPVGWVLASAGVISSFRVFANGYATFSAGESLGPLAAHAVVVVWISSWLGYGSVGLLGTVLLLSPHGRLPSARWRPVLWLQAASLALAMISAAIASGPLSGWPYMINPFGLPGLGDLPARLFQLSAVGVAAGLGLSVASLIVRLRQAETHERQQVKWVVYGAGVVAAAFPLVAISAVAPGVSTTWREALLLVFLCAFVVLGVSLAIGVLRYHLYDIDLVISRTLVYGALAAGITAVYAGVVAGVGSIIGSMSDSDPATVPTETLVLSLVVAALVAVVFQPLRERLQRLANRLVYGRRLSPYDVLADLSRRMAGALSVDAVLPRLAEAAAVGIGVTRARVRVYVPGGRDQAVAWPPEALGETFERTTPVLRQGEFGGEIAVSKPAGEPLTRTEQALLADLAAQAGPALGNVRLAADLRTQADELRASRQRIIAAQDQERRRIERDLHDGAQQHLVAMAVNLQIIQDLIEADPREAGALVSEVRSQVAEALGTLRDLARGIYPPALADHGLRAALEGHIAKTIPMARLESATAAGWRYPPEVEAAAYFCVLEALQNCAKHAPQTSVHVRLGADAAWLTFEVTDEGPGFEPAHGRSGTGLQGMTDRLAAVGGSLAIRSSMGHGTTVSGRLPIGHGRTTPSPA